MPVGKPPDKRVKFALPFLLALCSSGCAAQYYSCQLPDAHSWQELSGSPPNVESILQNSERAVALNIATADVVKWFERADGSFLVCIPSRIEGTCGRDKFFRENSCGQATYEFAKLSGGWNKADWNSVLCTCDPKVSH
jgi:hypothetical protein